MHHDISRYLALGILGRIRIDTGGIWVYVSRECHHRLQSNKKSARSEYTWREFRRNLARVGEPHNRHQNTGFDIVVLLHFNSTASEGTSNAETDDWNRTITSICFLQHLKDKRVDSIMLRRFLWVIGTARNALVVVLCAITSYIFEMYDGAPFVLTGHIDPGLPTFEPAPFSTTIGNQTESFVDMAKSFKFGILVVPLISIIGNVAIAKAFCTLFIRYFSHKIKKKFSSLKGKFRKEIKQCEYYRNASCCVLRCF